MFVMKPPRRSAGGFVAAVLAHAALLATLIAIGRLGAVRQIVETNCRCVGKLLVWNGDSGGGGGGGEKKKEPARQIDRKGHDAMSLPSAAPAPAESKPATGAEPEPVDALTIPAKSLGDALDSIVGILDSPVRAQSRGDGDGPGAGGGKGPGLGPGRGPGFDDGDGVNVGGGRVYRGDELGVTRPTALFVARTSYTNVAM